MPIEDEIEKTKEKLRDTPVNKSTETERGRLKSKIARLKEKKEKKEKGSGASGQGYAVRKRGDATVALVGPPSVGKSTLLNKLTNAESEVASYDFTTLDVIPGMVEFNGAKIQILDVPGLIGGAASGKGRGREVLSVVRNCDMILLMLDEDKLGMVDSIKEELYEAGVRANAHPPSIKIEKRDRGGIDVTKPPDMELDDDVIKKVIGDHGFTNCKIIIREDVGLNRLIDGVMDNRVYVPLIICINKIDRIEYDKLRNLKKENPDYVFISAGNGENLRSLMEKIWDELRIMRVYMKKRGKKPDMDEPLILKKGSSVGDVIDSLSKDFGRELKYAKIWGDSAKFPGQKVGGDHVLEDEDIVELRF